MEDTREKLPLTLPPTGLSPGEREETSGLPSPSFPSLPFQDPDCISFLLELLVLLLLLRTPVRVIWIIWLPSPSQRLQSADAGTFLSLP